MLQIFQFTQVETMKKRLWSGSAVPDRVFSKTRRQEHGCLAFRSHVEVRNSEVLASVLHANRWLEA